MEDERIYSLMHDRRIIDMGLRLASIPVESISDGTGSIIDGAVPMPTRRFVEVAGFEFVRRGGRITAEIDAYTVARAALAVRVMPMDQLLALQAEVDEVPDRLAEPPGDPRATGSGGAEA